MASSDLMEVDSQGLSSVQLPEPATTIAFERNAKTPFLKIPYEARLLIYEYAVALNECLCPRQVTERSNKFVWGYSHTNIIGDIGNRSRIIVSDEEVLTVTQLMNTCKQIYFDLSAKPVFYRVNTFRFATTERLHVFLAALTPRRRHELRNITLESCAPDSSGLWEMSKLGTNPQGSVNNHCTVLLRDCDSLRSLQLVMGTTFEGSESTPHRKGIWTYQTLEVLSDIPRHAASPTNRKSFWQFPISLKIKDRNLNKKWGWRKAYVEVDGNSPFLEELDTEPTARELFSKANYAISEHNEQVKAEKQMLKNRGFVINPTDGELHRAIDAARIDFPGDIRIQQTLASFPNVVARRTRSQLKEEGNITEWGTIRHSTPKYNSEGLLLWDYETLLQGIRRNGPAVEVQVEFTKGRMSDNSRYSWEEIHHIADWAGFRRVRIYFTKLMRLSVAKAEQQLAVFESIPKPEECESVFADLVEDQHSEEILKDWGRLKKNYPIHVNRVKKVVLEKQQAREIAEAQKKAKKDEKAKAAAAAKAEAKEAKARGRVTKASARSSKPSGKSTKKDSQSPEPEA